MARHKWLPAKKEAKKEAPPAKDKAEETKAPPAFQRTKSAAMRYSPKRAVRG